MILGFSLTEIIVYALVLITIVLVIWVIRLELRLRAFTRGKNGVSLEDSMSNLNKMLDRLFAHSEKTGKTIDDHDRRLKRTIQGVGTIRFNPFAGEGQGSNQSFATAFLSEDGNGVVISSLYSRDKVRVFAKPISGNQAEHELSTEERDALDKAKVI
ncbi:MAG TPA: DUF4446 family protein [Candidatus Paceibacterota bacterium]